MAKTEEQKRVEYVQAWQTLQRVIHPAIIAAPNVDWSKVEPRVVKYLANRALEKPWTEALALVVVIMSSYLRLELRTVEGHTYELNSRWRIIFPAYGLQTFQEWNPVEHIPRYIGDPVLSDSFKTRHEFLRAYSTAAHHIQSYLRSLPEQDRKLYRQWSMPLLPPDLYRQLSRAGELLEAQAVERKKATDAVVPHFTAIRSHAHLRWNQLKRLKEQYYSARSLVETGKAMLPLAFSYEEGGPHLHFLLWDRPSFVLGHADHYSGSPLFNAKHKTGSFSPENNHYFLEFVGSQSSIDQPIVDAPETLLWFGDLLRYGLFTTIKGTSEEDRQRQEYLKSWGYEPEHEGEEIGPFRTAVAGLLMWPGKGGAAQFMARAQKRSSHLLLMIDPLFDAATIALAAIDVFTTTGARMGELLQINLTPQCLYTLEVQGVQRLLLRLVPKGTDKPAEYIVGVETRRNFEKVALMLREHYSLKEGDAIPHVPFNVMNGRHLHFPAPRPYLFQYNGRHLYGQPIIACMRFLCHGLVFQAPDGAMVTLTAHLLRHVFATHIHHVEQVPLDIVAVILHQKNLRVTMYYAAPPWQKILESTNSLLDHFSTHLGSVDEAFLRAPQELQQQYEVAKERVGTLAKIPGGDCTCHAICPISFACTGCVFKVPDPTRRDEIVEQQQWALNRMIQVKERGMGPEAVKMQALIQRCQTELEEMNLMESYRKDEKHEVKLTIKHDQPSIPPLAPGALRSKATKDGEPRQSYRQSAPQRRTIGND